LAKAWLLVRRRRSDEAVVLYDAAIASLDGAPEPELLSRLVAAMDGAGSVLFRQERFEEAIEIYDRLVERVRDADRDIRKVAVLALNNKMAALNHLGRIDEASATHRE
jgi:tetratricopeptide (TPR) repeat protein